MKKDWPICSNGPFVGRAIASVLALVMCVLSILKISYIMSGNIGFV
ncbi:hypothetical protein [Dapis sp. BLCC M229]